jgi:hypothetical protein
MMFCDFADEGFVVFSQRFTEWLPIVHEQETEQTKLYMIRTGGSARDCEGLLSYKTSELAGCELRHRGSQEPSSA